MLDVVKFVYKLLLERTFKCKLIETDGKTFLINIKEHICVFHTDVPNT